MWRTAVIAVALVLATALPARSQVLDSLEARARRDSLDSNAQYDLAMRYWNDGRFRAADSALRRTVQINPRSAEGYFALGLLPYAEHRKLADQEEKDHVPEDLVATVKEANDNLRRAFLMDPFVGFGHGAFVFLPAFANRKFSERQRDKLPTWFFYWRGLTFARGQDYDKALADLQEVLDRFAAAREAVPQNSFLPLAANEIRYVMATIEARAGRTREARQRFEEVLNQDLGMYMAHVQLAEIHERNGAYNAAVRERQRALETNPGDPVLVFELGASMARAQMLPQADSMLSRAGELNPLDPHIPYMDARVRQAMGDTAGAVSAFQRFVAIAPSTMTADIDDARQQLIKLGQSPAQ